MSDSAHQEVEDRTLFGFWTYLMTDCVLFGMLFATFLVLHNGTYGGPTAKDLFSLPFALGETLVLLTSSFTCGLGLLAAHAKNRNRTLLWFAVTFLLGALFLGMELKEFSDFVHEGNSWQRSAFLSAFFTLVATHGLHITTGLLWMILLLTLLLRNGFTAMVHRRLMCLGLFWHFLDVVWIFIFTVVYLMGVMGHG